MSELREKAYQLCVDATIAAGHEDGGATEYVVDGIMDLITQSNRAFIERIRSELPEKFNVDPKEFKTASLTMVDKVGRELGFNDAIDDVTAVLTALEKSYD